MHVNIFTLYQFLYNSHPIHLSCMLHFSKAEWITSITVYNNDVGF